VEDYVQLEVPEEQEARAKAIYDQYIVADSPFEVNLSHKLREEVSAGMLRPSKETFTSAQKSIFLLLVHGTFDYFLRSDLYKMYKGTHTTTQSLARTLRVRVVRVRVRAYDVVMGN
jgi:hypothetical protein